MIKRPSSILDWAKEFIAPALKDGAVALDATAGRGYDTLFLAKGVLENGRVFAFDIQDEALRQTSEKLSKEGLLDRVSLFKENHREIKNKINEPLDAVMFNLGYLPGSDQLVHTNPLDTLEAMTGALELLVDKGRMSVVVYTGHKGAAKEARVVSAFAASLEEKYSVVKLAFWNGPLDAPELYLFSKSKEKS